MTNPTNAPRRLAGLAERRPLPFIPIAVRATAEETGGLFEVYEIGIPAGEVRDAAGDGPPPHVHMEHEEAFYVLEGEFAFSIADEHIKAPEGTFIVVPRGTVHAFTGAQGSRLLALSIPGGLAGFFEELDAGLASGRANAELRAALARKYDAHPAARGSSR